MILQISPCYVDMNSETGGVANIVRQICLNLHANKIKTVLVCTNTELGKVVARPCIIKYSDYLTIIVIQQNVNSLIGFRKSIYNTLNSIINVKSLIHVHTCFSVICDAALQYAVNKHIPCIFTPHGKFSPSMFANKRYLKEIYFKLNIQKNINKIDKIIVSSPEEMMYTTQLSIKTAISYIYNGYLKPEITPLSEQIRNISGPYLLYLGYLDSRKQPDLLIKAFGKSKALKECKLVLAGPDSYNYGKYLDKLVLSLNLSDKIIFTGRVLGYDKWYLLENAIGLFLPSKGEGWPVVLAEAIGAKIPLVISSACNFKDIATYNIGMELNDFEIQTWTNAIDYLYFNKEQTKIFQNNLNSISESFTWINITKQWINEYNSLISKY